ncbi:MAG: septum formation initiator family protein [Candidatus Blackburnbacteria bacterium]|nr:septum formation initiator family protein [Candidatus Blackburnbacteria bacterium]
MKKYLRYILFAGVLFVIFSMGRATLSFLERGKAIDRAKERVEELKKEQEELLKTKEKVESDEFIEKEAREKLGLAKPGETVVVLPDEDILRRLAPKLESESFPEELPIWKRWVEMFFKF